MAGSMHWYWHVLRWEIVHTHLKGCRVLHLMSKNKNETKYDVEDAGFVGLHDVWFEEGRCALSIQMYGWL